MKEYRSASQILFGFLPEQTVDLKGRVWKVKEWLQPVSESVDLFALRRELIRQALPWEAAGKDGGFVRDLRQQREVRVLSLNKVNGVKVIPFPDLWMCKKCNRLSNKGTVPCKCGYSGFGQLPFVGYHDECGGIREPYIPRCETHDDVKIVFPGTASAAEIKFECPICNAILRKGFGMPNCSCGKGQVKFNVHRAASVYTPRALVLVNAPSTARNQRLTEAGGPSRALEWVVDGMQTATFDAAMLTAESMRQQLIGSGLSESVADVMVKSAIDAGGLRAQEVKVDLPGDLRDEAEQEAVTVALALSESRVRLSDLQKGTETGAASSELNSLYRERYPSAVERAGLEAIELADKFPVLTGNFGYTRGNPEAGVSRLVPFVDRRGTYVVYGEVGATEALFVRLSPSRVATWLRNSGFAVGSWNDDRSARIELLRAAKIPEQGMELSEPTIGSTILTLVHTYAHRFIRRIATFAGVDRNSLSELLVPAHFGFFVYAASRGDFVLGGLQAVFETDLDRALQDIRLGDWRCPLDPGCQRGGGACLACLHLGEPSCRHYNRFLDRSSLFGQTGYLRDR